MIETRTSNTDELKAVTELTWASRTTQQWQTATEPRCTVAVMSQPSTEGINEHAFLKVDIFVLQILPSNYPYAILYYLDTRFS